MADMKGRDFDRNDNEIPTAGIIIDENCLHEEEVINMENHESKTKFNFSKPLCLLFSLLLVVSMLLPAISVKVHAKIDADTNINFERILTAIQIQPGFSGLVDMANNYGSLAGIDISAYGDTIWAVNGILLLASCYYVITMGVYLTFGIVGLFSKGKLRYFFARLGFVLHVIIMLILIIAPLVVNAILSNLATDISQQYSIELSTNILPTVWPFVSLVLAILFRIFGIKALRCLNGVSCMNRGDIDMATREFKLARNEKKLSMAQAKYRRVKHHPNVVIEDSDSDDEYIV